MGPGVNPEGIVRVAHGAANPEPGFRDRVLAIELPTRPVGRVPAERFEERIDQQRPGIGFGEAARRIGRLVRLELGNQARHLRAGKRTRIDTDRRPRLRSGRRGEPDGQQGRPNPH